MRDGLGGVALAGAPKAQSVSQSVGRSVRPLACMIALGARAARRPSMGTNAHRTAALLFGVALAACITPEDEPGAALGALDLVLVAEADTGIGVSSVFGATKGAMKKHWPWQRVGGGGWRLPWD